MPSTSTSVGFVIPTTTDSDSAVRTLEHIPDAYPVETVREGSLNEARNIGVRRLDTDQVVIMDDDIAFSEPALEAVVTRIRADHLVGMADWDFGWTAGRVMAFERDLWRRVGGFDERLRSHMGDTEFAMAVLKAGGTVERVPQTWFDHEDHARDVTALDRAWRLAYLCGKYPQYATHLVGSLAASAPVAMGKFDGQVFGPAHLELRGETA